MIVGRIHFSDVLQIGRLKTLFVGQDALERSNHVSARKLRAVMKPNILAQLELQLRALHLPGFRQHAAIAAFFVVGVDQRLHNRTPDRLEW